MEEKVGPNLQHVGLGSDFLNKTPKAQEIKARINKWPKELDRHFTEEDIQTINNI